MKPSTTKIISREDASAKGGQARANGIRIVLANGAFDLIHPGHVRYLEAARAKGDLLVVAVNSDASVRQAKGDQRPIQPERERAEMIAALECVDWVFLFDDATVEAVLREIIPAVHAKGTDYTAESVPERGVAKEIGCETVVTGDPKDHSTTDVIRVIVERFGEKPGERR